MKLQPTPGKCSDKTTRTSRKREERNVFTKECNDSG